MRARLVQWLTRTDDPLLRGDIPEPPGGRFSLPSDRSPHDIT